jgi:hypothetical protein
MSRLARVLNPTIPTLFELETLKVIQLRQLCRDQGLKGYSRLRKQELIDFLTSQSTDKKIIESSNISSDSTLNQKKLLVNPQDLPTKRLESRVNG